MRDTETFHVGGSVAIIGVADIITSLLVGVSYQRSAVTSAYGYIKTWREDVRAGIRTLNAHIIGCLRSSAA